MVEDHEGTWRGMIARWSCMRAVIDCDGESGKQWGGEGHEQESWGGQGGWQGGGWGVGFKLEIWVGVWVWGAFVLGGQVCDIVMRSQSFCKLATSVYFTGGSSHWESFVTLAIAVITMNKLLNYNEWYHYNACWTWLSKFKHQPSCLRTERDIYMVRHVWLGAKTLMPGLVFNYMHQIHSSIYAPSVDGWGDYVCIRRSLACLQGAIWGRLYHVCTRSGPRFDVLAMKLPSFQLKTFTVLLKWFNLCIISWGIWITHLRQFQTSSCN